MTEPPRKRGRPTGTTAPESERTVYVGVRLSQAGAAILDRMRALRSKATGRKVSQAEIVEAALRALKERQDD